MQHVNVFKPADEPPNDYEAISVYFRVMKGRNNYPSTLRNGIRSRKMAQYDGHSIKFESAEYQLTLGSPTELKSMSALMPNRLDPHLQDHHAQSKAALKTRLLCQRLPDPAYRALTPSISFNLSLEPALTFSLATFADKGSDEQIVGGRTSFKLLDQVLYLESDRERFEVSREPHSGKYRVAKVKDPYFKDNAYMMNPDRSRPLNEGTTLVADSLDWSDF